MTHRLWIIHFTVDHRNKKWPAAMSKQAGRSYFMSHLTRQSLVNPDSSLSGTRRMDVSPGLFRHIEAKLPEGSVKRVCEVWTGGGVLAEIELSTGQRCQDQTFYGAVLVARDYISRWEIPSIRHAIKELRHA